MSSNRLMMLVSCIIIVMIRRSEQGPITSVQSTISCPNMPKCSPSAICCSQAGYCMMNFLFCDGSTDVGQPKGRNPWGKRWFQLWKTQSRLCKLCKVGYSILIFQTSQKEMMKYLIATHVIIRVQTATKKHLTT